MTPTFRPVPFHGARRAMSPVLLLAMTISAASMSAGCSKRPGGSPAGSGSSVSTTVPPAPQATGPGSTPASGPITASSTGTASSSGPASGTPPDPAATDPAAPPAGPSSLQLSAAGLYLLDPPLAGEALFDGEIEVVVDGKAPPADTVVELNGVALAREARGDDADRFWHVDPAAPPPLRADGTVTVAARSGSLTGAIDLSCPQDIPLTSSTPAGASLSGATSLALGWPDPLPVNTGRPAFVSLRGLDLATSAPSPMVLAHRVLQSGALGTTLPVEGTTSSGYVVEMRWAGAPETNGNSDGSCGRAKRLVYAN